VVTEDTPLAPQSPYGQSKLVGEWLLADQATAVGLRHTSLRYFNVVGSGDPAIYDSSPHNLFPLVFEALLSGRTPRINGEDYATPDGTCVRDSCTWLTSRTPTWWRRGRSRTGRPWRRRTTSAAGPAARSARSWTRWPR
jgi:dTDP-D-glucose 4,6-dehydratase